MAKRLTDEQKKVVNHDSGHALVQAVPGSGKTTTLLKRVEYLIKQRGVSPKKILILMYNKSAQENFLAKLEKLLKNSAAIPEVKTLHSFARKILGIAVANKFLKEKKLVTPESQEYRALTREAFKVTNEGESDSFGESRESLESFFSSLKLESISPDDLENDPRFEDIPRDKKRAYRIFSEGLISNNLGTFDDLLVDAVNTARRFPEVIPDYEHVIIDEYQDINFIQQTLLALIRKPFTQMMAVGDANQCIYEWRGSRPDFINGIFQRAFPGTRVYTLSWSFRFGHQIALMANSVISRNQQKTNTLCVSHPSNFATQTYLHRDTGITRALIEIFDTSAASKTIAIIARSNLDLLEAELICKLLSIRYLRSDDKKVNELSFLLVCLCLLVDGALNKLSRHQNFTLHLEAFLFHVPFSFKYDSNKRREVIKALSLQPDATWFVLERELTSSKELEVLRKLKELSTKVTGSSLSLDTLLQIQHCGLFNDLAQNTTLLGSDSVNFTPRAVSILKETNMSCDEVVDSLLELKTNKSRPRVELMTVHKAKGMEWDTVVFTGLNDRDYPGNDRVAGDGKSYIDLRAILFRASQDTQRNDLEEERRLFYVGITRAKKQLHLILPADPLLEHWLQNQYSSTPKKEVVATRFVYEMNQPYFRLLAEDINSNRNVTLVPKGPKWASQYLRQYQSLPETRGQ